MVANDQRDAPAIRGCRRLLHHVPSGTSMVVTREECLDALWWGQDLLDSRTLDAHVKRLRRKIEADPAEPRHLITVRGVGFRFQS